MSAKEFASQLKQTIQDIKAKGAAAVDCDNLIAYLDEVVASPSVVVTPAELEHYKAQLQIEIEQSRGQHASDLEMFRSVITAGQNAIRSSFLLNGGAAVAVLAFISKLTESQTDKVSLFSESLLPFVAGVFAISFSSGLTYLSQWFYATDDGWKIRTGFWLNIAAILVGLSSFGLFIWGMCRAYAGFQSFV
jgi:hypothetical protein